MSNPPFEPIAIVGRGCVLPGALDADALDRVLAEGADLLASPPAGYWGVRPERAPCDEDGVARWTDRGGYVRGFEEQFDAERFRALGADRLDPMVRWCLQAAREALAQSGRDRVGDGERGGVILGNLSLPTPSLASFADSVHLARQASLPEPLRPLVDARPDALNRFMSGYPAAVVARAFGLEIPSFALDAACASSLYALKLACDRLQDRTADLMLAGAVNGADPLFLHIGFRALQAMSPTGQSRPFHRAADGLVPAEGAAFVALRRLSDALDAGEPILGVIRGVGLSNDGGRAGFLVPASPGQVAAMRAAYTMAAIDPAEVDYVECHATGTAVGDATELASMREVFGERPLRIGSMKSNVGHLVTASGMAGLIKVLGSFRSDQIPATLHTDSIHPAVAEAGYQVVDRPTDWTSERPRIAGISSFGFGGNNAHLIVEEWRGQPAPTHPGWTPPAADPIAIDGIGAVVGSVRTIRDVCRVWFNPEAEAESGIETIGLDADHLRFPPRDLAAALGQQLAIYQAAQEAVRDAGTLDPVRTGVFVGMQCDPEITRHVLRVRAGDRLDAAGWNSDLAGAIQDAISPPLDAATVLGLLPNIPANRLNTHWRLEGPGFTVSAEQASGIAALEIAMAALRSGELDAAIVGAVDLSREEVQEAAGRELDVEAGLDAAVVLVLRRAADSPDPYALLGSPAEGAREIHSAAEGAYAASGLLTVARTAIACASGRDPDAGERPWIVPTEQRTATVEVRSQGGDARRVGIAAVDRSRASRLVDHGYRLLRFAADSRPALIEAVRSGTVGGEGAQRLAIVVPPGGDPQALRDQAIPRLETGDQAFSEGGIVYRPKPVEGDLAAVFTGAASAYRGMAGDLLAALPDLGIQASSAAGDVARWWKWTYAADSASPSDLEQLAGASLVCQAHAVFTRDRLGLKPDLLLGLSSGETNSLAAFGLWTDLDGLLDGLEEEGLYSRELAGEYRALERAWGQPIHWVTRRVFAASDAVREAVEAESRVRLLTIHTPDDCVIGGDGEAVDRVLERLDGVRSTRVGYDLAVHLPELGEVGEIWRRLHVRPTTAVPGLRFYSASNCAPVEHHSEAIAHALTAMASSTIDFPRLIRKAWDDGARIFVEHGPGSACTSWIRHILGDRPHLAIALDDPGRGSLHAAALATAELWAAGQAIDTGWLKPEERPSVREMVLPSRPPAIVLPAISQRDPEPTWTPVQLPAAPTIGMPGWPTPPVYHGPEPKLLPVVPPRPAAPAAHLPVGSPLAALWQQQSALHQHFLEAQTRAWQSFLAITGRSGAAVQSPYGMASGPALTWVPVAYGQIPAAETYGPAATAHPAAYGAASNPVPASQCATMPIDGAGDMPTATAATTAGGIDPTAPTSQPAGTAAAPTAPPLFDRADLEELASGQISRLFGSDFAAQDGYRRQVRMPMPPLLLADRVLRIDAEPRSMGTGRIVTETDVTADAWYLHQARMPFGLFIESGQADLLLISWLGADLLNRDERVYRLLGCELTVHGPLPTPGDTLHFDIHVDGHASQGPIRIFFFHYDCYVDGELRMSMRNGQAGFFTDAELDASGGVIWDPTRVQAIPDARLDAPRIEPQRRQFDTEALRAFAAGRVADCFGAEYWKAYTHTRTPRLPEGRMLLLDQVTDLDPSGGPWGRGYLRAETTLTGDEWFFPGHFKNDPAMPGTLMIEACVQAMAFYLTALGHTLDHDGWTFQPAVEEPYKMVCRGQVTPESRELVYEIFVEEVHDGPEPTLFADVLLTVDGLKAFHCRRLGIRLAPDWPLAELRPESHPGRVATEAEFQGFRFDEHSLLACAWGPPSEAFGPRYLPFDGVRTVPRLPGPPYHFISRVLRVSGADAGVQAGAEVEVEYDVPRDAWYLEHSGHGGMPFAVLLEVGLQPCGWLTALIGVPLSSEHDLSFRNLDGDGTMHRQVDPNGGPIRTHVRMTNIVRTADSYIETFAVRCTQDGDDVFEMTTVFGHFRAAALARQVGLPAGDLAPAWETEGAREIDLTTGDPALFCGAPRMPGSMLRMLDRAWIGSDEGGAPRLRAELEVDPDAWFFKAHFYQDPVQPGSLGVEAMIQLLHLQMLDAGMAEGIAEPKFEPLGSASGIEWKYRGQVLPHHERMTVDLVLRDSGRDARGAWAIADAWLSVDGTTIYRSTGLAGRIVEGASELPRRVRRVIDPAVDRWLLDHRPTLTLPVYPLAGTIDLFAGAVAEAEPGRTVIAVEDLRTAGWLICDRPRQLEFEIEPDSARPDARVVTMRALGDGDGDDAASVLARGVVITAEQFPAPPAADLEPLRNERTLDDLYAPGHIFHGPSFQVITRALRGDNGATVWLDPARSGVPRGSVAPAILDAAMHALPHDEPDTWFAHLDPGLIAYPSRFESVRFFAAAPEGEVRIEIRPLREAGPHAIRYRAIWFAGDQIWADAVWTEAAFPKGRFADLSPAQRWDFLAERRYVSGARLSEEQDDQTRLQSAVVRRFDWLPGTVRELYRLVGDPSPEETVRQVAIKEHVGERARVHPSRVTLQGDVATAASLPLNRFHPQVETEARSVTVRTPDEPRMETEKLRDFWEDCTGAANWPIEDLYFGWVKRFVRCVEVSERVWSGGLENRGAIYLANHQTGVESLLFSVITSGLFSRPIITLAKTQHQSSPLGQLLTLAARFPGARIPRSIEFFDKAERGTMLSLLGDLGQHVASGHSLLVHAEGTRSVSARTPVTQMSSTLIDLALKLEVPLVPVRFAGGLPTDPASERLEFPLGFGRQDIFIGNPIEPAELARLAYGERRAATIDAINRLGPPAPLETPLPGDPEFAARVQRWMSEHEAGVWSAAAGATLAENPSPSELTLRLLAYIRGEIQLDSDSPTDQWLAEFAAWLAPSTSGTTAGR